MRYPELQTVHQNAWANWKQEAKDGKDEKDFLLMFHFRFSSAKYEVSK